MSNAVQMSFPFDMTACGPVAEAMAQAEKLAGIVEKVNHDIEMWSVDVDGPDFEEV